MRTSLQSRFFVAFVALVAAANARCVVAAPAVLAGQWGGEGANLVAGEDGVTVELPCAFGSIAGRVPLDERNEFDVAGTIRAAGGAVPSEESGATAPQAVRFRGRIEGSRLVLTIAVPDASDRRFTLQEGAEARVPLCP